MLIKLESNSLKSEDVKRCLYSVSPEWISFALTGPCPEGAHIKEAKLFSVKSMPF